MDQVNTFSQFDNEVSTAYKKDKFFMKRLEGLLDIRHSWNKWLRYRNYGTTKKSSRVAKAQGGRQEDVMCMRFYKNAAGLVLMQYKYMESDRYWLPYNEDGIPVFSDNAPSTIEEKLQAPPIKDPVPWPERPQVEKHILEQAKVSDKELVEWQQFFNSIPECADDIPDSKRFKWLVPELAAKFKAARSSQ